jgi:hypothetical protein
LLNRYRCCIRWANDSFAVRSPPLDWQCVWVGHHCDRRKTGGGAKAEVESRQWEKEIE